MKWFQWCLCALILTCTLSLEAQQSPVGIWQTVDDETGEKKSHVEIYEKDGRFHGRIVKLLLNPEDSRCQECPGDKKGQLLVGMEILWNLKSYKDYWSYGKIMDPENGKTYKVNIYLEKNNELRVRGYIGIAVLGRNQTWHRVE